MKIFIIIAGILIILTAALLITIKISSRPLSKTAAGEKICNLLESAVKKNKTVTGAMVYIDSPGFGFTGEFSAGGLGHGSAFHVASVGKAFTSSLIGSLIDEGKIRLEDRIIEHLPSGTLEGLFVIDGIDYRKEVTVAQLLSHTSGAADYFEDPAEGSTPMIELITAEPDRFWSPIDLIAFSRDVQSPAGKPGEQYHYSDTGYILLGLIIEELTGQGFHEVLHERIFEPLQMNDSSLMFYSQPVGGKRPLAEIWIDGTEVSGFNSVSIDWAGGGIVSTAADLAVFVRALNSGRIISEETLSDLYSFEHRFMRGIHYGMGFMEYHFEEFFPTLGSMPNLRGHMGILGTQMLYDKETDTVYISSFGSDDYAGGSVRTMIKVLNYTMRIRK